VNKKGDEVAKPEGEAFRVNFKATVLKVDRAEVTSFLRDKDNLGLIDGAEVCGKGVEILEGGHEGILYKNLVLSEKGGAKAIRARVGVVVHGKKGNMDLGQGERPDEGSGLGGIQFSGRN
jgi:hypothetical protein